jgi:hypothetical protein
VLEALRSRATLTPTLSALTPFGRRKREREREREASRTPLLLEIALALLPFAATEGSAELRGVGVRALSLHPPT